VTEFMAMHGGNGKTWALQFIQQVDVTGFMAMHGGNGKRADTQRQEHPRSMVLKHTRGRASTSATP
jgi:hypothetical protein